MHKTLAAIALSVSLSGCATVGPGGLPRTPGETASNYGYVPLDPLPINQTDDADSCKELKTGKQESLPLLEALPDLAIRFAVADIDASGGLTFGPSKITASGDAYRAVLDYVNADAVPRNFLVRKFVGRPGFKATPEKSTYIVDHKLGEYVEAYEVRLVDMDAPMAVDDQWDLITIPIYVGVGLRLSADIRAAKSGISLSGLGTIGAQAEASALSGTLTVQTLGVNGRSLAMALPLPNKLDQTTIEAGILAIGSSRAMLYTAGTGGTGEQVTATPRVVGLYSPVGSDPAFINAVYAELSRERTKWPRPCRAVKKAG